jgi:hypothetical protein
MFLFVSLFSFLLNIVSFIWLYCTVLGLACISCGNIAYNSVYIASNVYKKTIHFLIYVQVKCQIINFVILLFVLARIMSKLSYE